MTEKLIKAFLIFLLGVFCGYGWHYIQWMPIEKKYNQVIEQLLKERKQNDKRTGFVDCYNSFGSNRQF